MTDRDDARGRVISRGSRRLRPWWRSARPLVFCALFATCVLPAALPAQARSTAQGRPNVLLILSDDQGWGDLGSSGNQKIDTPVLDRLAAEGARFERFYVTPLCAPTRAGLLTGRHALRTGVADVTRGGETMRSEEITLAEIFGAAGYATGIFGKWHNGGHYPVTPEGQGFQEFFGFLGGHWNDNFDPILLHGGEPVRTRGYITDLFTDAALHFIRRNRDRPFFAYVPYSAPHAPFQLPDEFFDKYRARGLDDKTSAVYGMVDNMDGNIGRLLAAIDELGLREETIVLFLTDNGPNGERYNGGMRGTKGSVHEGGVRVPLFVRWPGRISSGHVVTPITSHLDLLPTLVELAGLPAPRVEPLDGISLVPLLTGGPPRTLADRRIFTHRAKPDDAGTLPCYPGSVRTQRYRAVRTDASWELYDMLHDPGQARDIARDQQKLTAELGAAYDAWFAEVSRAGVKPAPIVVGHPRASKVRLPAPEARFTGGLQFAGRSGFAHDWLTNWSRPEAEASWEIDVVRPGRYRVVLMHTSPPEAVGSRVTVSAGAGSTTATVAPTGPHQPTLRPERVKPEYVLVKEFTPLPAGTIHLDRGRLRLTVRVDRAVAGGVLDLESVVLERVSD